MTRSIHPLSEHNYELSTINSSTLNLFNSNLFY